MTIESSLQTESLAVKKRQQELVCMSQHFTDVGRINEHSISIPGAYNLLEKNAIVEGIVKEGWADTPQIQDEDPQRLMHRIDDFIHTADLAEMSATMRPRPIYADTDFIIPLSGPGRNDKDLPPPDGFENKYKPDLSHNKLIALIQTGILRAQTVSGLNIVHFPYDKIDRYSDIDTTRRMEHYRLMTTAALLNKVAALRVGKEHGTATKQEVLAHAPMVMYPGTPEEVADLQQNLLKPSNHIPIGKVRGFGQYELDGKQKTVINTFTQAESLYSLNTVDPHPRRVLFVSHASHFGRFRCMLALQNNLGRLPRDIKYQAYPIANPKELRVEGAIMDGKGFLASIYKNGQGAPEDFPLEFT